MDELFAFGKCLICGKGKALKNDICAECANKEDIPDFLKDLFKNERDE